VLAVCVCCCGTWVAVDFLPGYLQRQSGELSQNDLTFDVSRDGKYIVFAADGKGYRDLYLLSRESGQIQALTSSDGLERQPSFSHDGKQIAFKRGIVGELVEQLCVMDIASGRVTQMTDKVQNVSTPTFSNDGKSVIFALETKYVPKVNVSTWKGSGQLTSLDLRTKKQTKLVPEPREAAWPTVSSNGRYLAWKEFSGISVAPVNQPRSYRLLASKGSNPTFSADGKQVAYVTGKYIPDFHVEIVSIEGGEPVIVPNTDAAMQVKFLPNGRILVLREFWRKGGFGLPSRAVWEIGVDGTGAKEVITEAMFSDPLGREATSKTSYGAQNP